jgi:GDP/UDP-N,N'-diacetylbacillosamine 2-epimerase (hydrolysing)
MKKICIYTGARSEYGLLRPLISRFLASSKFETQLVVGAGHTIESQGNTILEIESDAFPIHTVLQARTEADSPKNISDLNAYQQIDFATYLNSNHPDLVVVLGDRSELLSIAAACMLFSVPLAHISGGEVTEGAIDNQIRHALTKMAHIHFPATETYKKNIISMGEEVWRICVSGEPGLDEILSLELPDETTFRRLANLPQDHPFVISTFHSETINQSINKDFLNELIEKITREFSFHILFTAANIDEGGVEINQTLEQLSQINEKVHFVKSLGKRNYYAAQRYAIAMLGNSSSGIVEAHSFNLPVVNVGSRQDGRLRNANCIDAAVDADQIIKAIQTALKPDFRQTIAKTKNIYGDGDASIQIVEFIKRLDWSSLLIKKSMF